MANIPTEEECAGLLEQYHVPKNVKEHIEQVKRVSLFLAKKVKEKGGEVNLDLVRAAAMLHDVLKPIDFFNVDSDQFLEEDLKIWKKLKEKFNGLDHLQAAYELFKDKYPEVAVVIKKHAYNIIDSDDDAIRPSTWAEKIVNYADKRVAYSDIVTLEFRFEEGFSRWKKHHGKLPMDEEKIKHINAKFFELEKEIFSFIDLEPEKLKNYVDNEDYNDE